MKLAAAVYAALALGFVVLFALMTFAVEWKDPRSCCLPPGCDVSKLPYGTPIGGGLCTFASSDYELMGCAAQQNASKQCTPSQNPGPDDTKNYACDTQHFGLSLVLYRVALAAVAVMGITMSISGVILALKRPKSYGCASIVVATAITIAAAVCFLITAYFLPPYQNDGRQLQKAESSDRPPAAIWTGANCTLAGEPLVRLMQIPESRPALHAIPFGVAISAIALVASWVLVVFMRRANNAENLGSTYEAIPADAINKV